MNSTIQSIPINNNIELSELACVFIRRIMKLKRFQVLQDNDVEKIIKDPLFRKQLEAVASFEEEETSDDDWESKYDNLNQDNKLESVVLPNSNVENSKEVVLPNSNVENSKEVILPTVNKSIDLKTHTQSTHKKKKRPSGIHVRYGTSNVLEGDLNKILAQNKLAVNDWDEKTSFKFENNEETFYETNKYMSYEKQFEDRSKYDPNRYSSSYNNIIWRQSDLA